MARIHIDVHSVPRTEKVVLNRVHLWFLRHAAVVCYIDLLPNDFHLDVSKFVSWQCRNTLFLLKLRNLVSNRFGGLLHLWYLYNKSVTRFWLNNCGSFKPYAAAKTVFQSIFEHILELFDLFLVNELPNDNGATLAHNHRLSSLSN